MTIAPDVLEELDFPTPPPEPTPMERAQKMITDLQEALETLFLGDVMAAVTEAFAELAATLPPVPQQMGILEESTHYCWCSPSRSMLFDSDLSVTAQTWFGDNRYPMLDRPEGLSL